MTLHHPRRHRFAERLSATSPQDRFDAVVAEVSETSGEFTAPNDEQADQWFLDLHGVQSQGASACEAVSNWLDQAQSVEGVQDA